MMDYMIWSLSNKNFIQYDDFHHTLHGEILYLKCKRLFNGCIEHFPWKSDKVLINNETLIFITSQPYHIHINRFPIVIKELSKIDFSKCDDIQSTIHDKLLVISKKSTNINKYIIETFPSNNCNVNITKENIKPSAIKYYFPESRLDLLVKILSDIDFINCDDIHLLIDKTILTVKNKLILKKPTFVKTYTIDFTNIPPFSEKAWIEIFKAYIAKKYIYFDNENNILTNIDYWLYPGEEMPIYSEIKFNVAMCMMCNKMKDPEYDYDIILRGANRTGNNNLEINHINKGPYICKKLCNMSIKNSNHILPQKLPRSVTQIYYCDTIWKLRHLRNKLLLIKYSYLDHQSIFSVLPYDIINILLHTYLDIVNV
jgi:hypothetical protein